VIDNENAENHDELGTGEQSGCIGPAFLNGDTSIDVDNCLQGIDACSDIGISIE
jgi:hypothetical protein